MEIDAIDLNTSALIFSTAMWLLILALPRRQAIIPMIMIACYITLAQLVQIGPFHFSMMRIAILCGWIRILCRQEHLFLKFNTIDKAIVLWVFVSSVIYILRLQTADATINRLGFVYDKIGLYFFFRCFITDIEDLYRTLKFISIIIIPLSIAMIIEYSTGRNLFSIFGGVKEVPEFRDGRFRCQGSFRHAILIGTFAATLMPLFIALWVKGQSMIKYAIIGIFSTVIITLSSGSSGPLIAIVISIIGSLLWPLRNYMRFFRWAIVMMLVALHLLMNDPVWYLQARISGLTGGTGYHRSALIDATIHHFNEWWLLGTDYTRHWMPTGVSWSEKHTDITNQFIYEGINGGLIGMILFVAVILLCFKLIGIVVSSLNDYTLGSKKLFWFLGVALTAHTASFTSVVYFDQIIVFWYMLLAFISLGSSLSHTSETDHSIMIGPPLPKKTVLSF